jgi:hypothetical protein
MSDQSFTSDTPNILIFFREGGFYLIEAPATKEEARLHAERNPGTLRVEDAHGNILWRPN